jgi:hypothetical protein
MFSRLPSIVAALFVVTSLVTGARAAQNVVDNSSFDVGFGYNDSSFNTNQTIAANTPTTTVTNLPFTVGDFQYTISISTGLFGSTGPTFHNRVLGNGDASASGMNASSNLTSITVSSTYVGTLPGDYIPGTESFELNIEQFSVYFLKHPAYVTVDTGDDDTGFYERETTIGNVGQSPTMVATPNSDMGTAANYLHLVWDPSDFLVPSSMTSTRTFTFRPGDFTTDPAGVFVIDGLEFVGSGNLHYQIVPEPGTLSLVGVGAGALLLRRRRSK